MDGCCLVLAAIHCMAPEEEADAGGGSCAQPLTLACERAAQRIVLQPKKPAESRLWQANRQANRLPHLFRHSLSQCPRTFPSLPKSKRLAARIGCLTKPATKEAMSRVLQVGRNCWRVERANRFALLVDGADYYTTLAKAIRRAQRWIGLLAWDLDTRTELVEHDPGERTGSLQQFLRDTVAHNQNLQIAILSWDFPILFAHVRDPKLVRGEDPFQHNRILFKSDDVHPPGGSHHQKIVSVDGKLAFSGGMDVAGGRWDTSEHRPQDPRRGYPPSHDVQAMVDGDAAAALAEIVRDRWHRATGRLIPEPEPGSDPWPEDVPADLTDVDVAISRTDPLISCREVERLHLDLIAAAREFLYI